MLDSLVFVSKFFIPSSLYTDLKFWSEFPSFWFRCSRLKFRPPSDESSWNDGKYWQTSSGHLRLDNYTAPLPTLWTNSRYYEAEVSKQEVAVMSITWADINSSCKHGSQLVYGRSNVWITKQNNRSEGISSSAHRKSGTNNGVAKSVTYTLLNTTHSKARVMVEVKVLLCVTDIWGQWTYSSIHS
jgi:hypothetical protein